jgi:hypothetical protein
LVFWQGLGGSFRNSRWQKPLRLQGPWQAVGEVQIYRILANKAIIKRILHTNRKGGFYGVFHMTDYNKKTNRSPNWAYFPIDLNTRILVYYSLHHSLCHTLRFKGIQIHLPLVAGCKSGTGMKGNTATSLLERDQSLIFTNHVQKTIAGM